MRSFPATLAGAFLLLLAAGCGGGSGSNPTPVNTPGFSYSDPTNRTGEFALVRDPASTGSTLILDLVGPAYSGIGVSFSLKVDTTMANWNTSPAVLNGTVFNGGSPIVQGWVSSGNLQAVVSNKGLGTAVKSMGTGTIARIQLNLPASPGKGIVSLADSGFSTYLDASGGQRPFKVQVGTLTVQ